MKVTIIDYQMGNLRSVQKALERVGAEAVLSSQPEEVLAAEKIVLPGVGAFGDAARELRERNLNDAIRDAIARGTPFLGICLGLQLLFDRSDESPHEPGLGIVAGEVKRFVPRRSLKVPHMGWNTLTVAHDKRLVGDQPSDDYYYFVHSYYVSPRDDSWVAAETDYGELFCSMIAQGNLFATQFHPEKSQAAGLTMLERFVRL